MGYAEELKKSYDSMYNSRYEQLMRDKAEKQKAYEQQRLEATDRYTTGYKQYQTQKTDTQNKYSGMYTGLDNSKKDAEGKYYNDKNQVASSNARQTQKIRDYMANANLLQSGESVDAQLRNNTDFNNNMTGVYNNEQATYRGIEDKRNTYKLDENRAYQDIDNQINNLTSERDRVLNGISSNITGLETDFQSRNKSLRDEIDSNYIKDLNEYNERIRQEELQRKRLEEERAYQDRVRQESRYSSSNGGSSSGGITQEKNDIYANFMNKVQSQDNYQARDFLNNSKDEIINTYGSAYYKKLEDDYWNDMGNYYKQKVANYNKMMMS